MHWSKSNLTLNLKIDAIDSTRPKESWTWIRERPMNIFWCLMLEEFNQTDFYFQFVAITLTSASFSGEASFARNSNIKRWDQNLRQKERVRGKTWMLQIGRKLNVSRRTWIASNLILVFLVSSPLGHSI